MRDGVSGHPHLLEEAVYREIGRGSRIRYVQESSPRQGRRYLCLFLAPAADTVRSVNDVAQFPLARIIAVTSSVRHGHHGRQPLRKDILMAKPDSPLARPGSAHPLFRQQSGEGP
jgi:hypothetical protein